jgi:hypothetical protein
MRIGKHRHLRRNCGSAAVCSDKSIHYSARGCDGQFHSAGTTSDYCKARCETCLGFGHQDADGQFIADCGEASGCGTKFYGGEDSGRRNGAASRCCSSFSAQDRQG